MVTCKACYHFKHNTYRGYSGLWLRVDSYRRFRETYCLHLQSWRRIHYVPQKYLNPPTSLHIPEEQNRLHFRLDNLKSHVKHNGPPPLKEHPTSTENSVDMGCKLILPSLHMHSLYNFIVNLGNSALGGYEFTSTELYLCLWKRLQDGTSGWPCETFIMLAETDRN